MKSRDTGGSGGIGKAWLVVGIGGSWFLTSIEMGPCDVGMFKFGFELVIV